MIENRSTRFFFKIKEKNVLLMNLYVLFE